jgi:hypothetical protein
MTKDLKRIEKKTPNVKMGNCQVKEQKESQ